MSLFGTKKFALAVVLLGFFGALWASAPGPYADLILPTPAHWSGCSLQVIKIKIADSTDAVDTSTIHVRVAGIDYYWGDSALSWVNDSILIIVPDSAFGNGDTVLVELVTADDTSGFHLQGAPRQWNFYVDLDLPFFDPDSRYPPPGTTVCSGVGSIAVVVMDTTSGIPYDGLCMCFNSYWFTCPTNRSSGFCWQPMTNPVPTYADSVFFMRWGYLDSMGYLAAEDSIEVCLRKAVDRVGVGISSPESVCGPHWFDTTDSRQCWSFVKDCAGPLAFLVFPGNGDTTACDSIVFYFRDYSQVDTTNVQLYITGGGMPYISSSPYFNANSTGDTAFYIGTLPEGNITAHIIRTRDINGNWRTSHPWWNFFVDKSPPVASAPNPPEGGAVSVDTPFISVRITDSRTAVETSSVVVTVEDDTLLMSDSSVWWDSTRVHISTSLAGISFSDGDTVNVCVTHACDIVDSNLCGPNCITSPFCFWFYIDQSGPVAHLVSPPDSAFTACDSQGLILTITDPNGVDSTTIFLVVDSVTYDSMENMTFISDTLIFAPDSAWSDGDTVYWQLTAAEDSLGNPLYATLSGFFVVDLSPPIFLSISPPQWTMFGPSWMTVEFTLYDSGAGVDPSTATITVNGHSFSYPSGFSWTDSILSFNLATTGLSLADGDTILVCLEVGDSIPPSLCGPNMGDSCIRYIADLAGPLAEMVFPLPESITACADSFIVIVFSDPNGLDTSSVTIRVNGVSYSVPSPSVRFLGDTLFFEPAAPFAHGDTILVEVTSAEDTFGNDIDTTYSWWFVVDTLPPVLVDYFPNAGDGISSPSPLVRIWLEDFPAGVDSSTVTIRVNDTVYTISDSGVSWSSGQIIFNSAVRGLTFSDGDTVEVCLVSVSDRVSADYCGPNSWSPDTCWWFYIDLSGPTTYLMRPDEGSYTSCDTQQIWVYIYDPEGVIPESTAIRVNSDTFRAWLGELTMDGSIAKYRPSTPFIDGQVVSVQVVHATDSLGNTTTSGDVWTFTVDLSPPVWLSTDPPPDTFIADSTPTITLSIVDSLAGVDTLSFTITIGSSTFVGTSAGVRYSGGRFIVDLDSLGLSFSDGETLSFCLDSVGDLARYCGANVLVADSCWNYYIDLSGPYAQLVFPESLSFFACENGTIKIVLDDNFGVDTSTIRVSVNGISYDLSDTEIWWSSDTIYYSPSVPFSHGDTVEIEVVSASDFAGNPISFGGPWRFFIDTEGPEVIAFVPPSGSFIGDPTDTIYARLRDEAGVDSTGIRVFVAGTLVSSGYWFDGDSVRVGFVFSSAGISPSSGDTYVVCVGARDLVPPSYCGPNEGDTSCARFIFDLEGPLARFIVPPESSYTTCNNQRIQAVLTDNYAVSLTSINLRVNGVNYTLANPELSYTGDSLLTFMPSLPYPEGMVTVVLWGVTDHVGHPLAGDSVVLHFFTDYSPPVVTSISPPPGDTIMTDRPTFLIGLADSGAGVDDSSIVVTVNGTPFGLSSGCVSWDDSVVSITPFDCGMTFDDGDSITVCISASDNPDLCPPNEMADTCWHYIISTSGPLVTLLTPPSGAVSSCNDQNIMFRITDGNGVDSASIRLNVNGTIYTISDPELSFYNDTLEFTPSSLWSDGDTVVAVLTRADDMVGMSSPDVPESVVFVIDLSPPYVASLHPPARSGFASAGSTITIVLTDDIAGVNPATINLRIDGLLFTYPSGDMRYSNDTLTFSVSGMGYIPYDGESLLICVNAMDMPTLCTPNLMSDYCFKYFYDFTGPIIIMLFPYDSVWTSCYDTMKWRLYDISGIDTSSILLIVDGDSCDLSSSAVYLTGGQILHFDSDTDLVEGTMFDVVVQVKDKVGNPGGPDTFWVGFDTTAPVISDPHPLPETILTMTTPLLSVRVSDNASGVDYDSAIMIINGTDTLTYLSGELSWSGDSLYADLSALGIGLDSMGTTYVCVDGFKDSVWLCGPNIGDSMCWRFYIDAMPPQPELIIPPDSAVVSCETVVVEVMLHDVHGIDWSLTRFNFRGSEVLTTSPGMTILSDTSFRYSPPFSLADGETIAFYVSQSADTLGNFGFGYPTWHIIIDRSPPRITFVDPHDSSYINYFWCAGIFDSIAGVDTSSVQVLVNGIVTDRTISAETVCVNLSSFAFADGETVFVCITARDLVTWCDPNEMALRCFTYFIDRTPPTASLLHPPYGAVTSCVDQRIIWRLIDNQSSIEESTITVIYEGDTLTISDPRLSYEGDSLIFTPDTLIHGDTVRAILFSASDVAGNADTFNIEGMFIVDLSPPYARAFPPESTVITTPSPSFRIEFIDSPAGVDTATIVIVINGDTVSFLWTDSGAVVDCRAEGITFADRETVTVCVSAADLADICPANVMAETCFTYFVNLSGPVATIISPARWDFNACDSTEQNIVMTIFDADGVDTLTVVFVVEGDTFTIASPELEFSNDTLTFTPSSPWRDGDTVCATLVSAQDVFGNDIAYPVEWCFVMDLSPPTLGSPSPSDSSIVTSLIGGVSVVIVDEGSGVDSASIMLWIEGGTDTFTIGSGLLWHDSIASVPGTLLTAYSGTLTICARASDMPDVCGPNEDSLCWVVFVVAGGPTAIPLVPAPSQIISCRDTEQILLIYLYDEDGIDLRRTVLWVNGDSVAFIYAHDTLIYVPSPSWEHGETVHVALISYDSAGFSMVDTLRYWFVVDTLPPDIGIISPHFGWVSPRFFGDSCIKALIIDDIAGVNRDSTIVNLRLVDYHHDSVRTVLLPSFAGDTANICPHESLLILGGIDTTGTLTVCIKSSDLAQLCGNNAAESCFTWLYDPIPPRLLGRFPPEFVVTNCPESAFAIVADYESGIFEGACSVVVNDSSVPFSITSAGTLSWSTPPYETGDTIQVALIMVDTALNDTSYYLHFVVDTTPPIAINPEPPPLTEVRTTVPTISVILIDSITAVDESTIVLIVNGDTFTVDSAGVYFEGDTLRLVCDSAGVVFREGDTVEVCVVAADTVRMCSANVMAPFCWSFRIASMTGPIASRVFPPDSAAIISCRDTTLLLLISDPDGVAESTIVFVANAGTLTTDSLALTLRVDTLIYDLSRYSSGETLRYALLRADDIYGNPLVSALYGMVVFDFSSPVLIAWENDTATSPSPVLWFVLVDSISGVDWSTFTLIVGHDTLTSSSPGVTTVGDTIFVDLASAGIALVTGTNTMVIRIGDSPDYCEPNYLDTTLVVYGLFGLPTVELISPPDNSIISCDGGNIWFVLHDSDGIIYDSAGLVIGDTLRFVWGDRPPQLSLRGDTIIFNAPGMFSHGDVLRVRPIGCDSFFNWLPPITWIFIVDLLPPDARFIKPDTTMPVYDSLAIIRVAITDEPAGVNDDSIAVEIVTPRRAWFLTPDSTGVTFVASTLSVDPFEVNRRFTWRPELDSVLLYYHENETIYVFLRTCDNALVCGNNCTMDTFSFFTLDDDTLPPYVILPHIEPHPGETVTITIPAFDSSGVDSTCTYVIVDGGTLRVSVVSSGDSFLVVLSGFVVPPLGETLRITLHICDRDLDFMRESDRSETTYTLTIISTPGEGPDVRILMPHDGDFTSCRYGPILLLVTDPDGVDTASLVLSDSYEVVWSGDTAFIYPYQPWNDGDTIGISVVQVRDVWGNPGATDSVWFVVDISPPAIELISPNEGIIDSGEVAQISISDSLSGISEAVVIAGDTIVTLYAGINHLPLGGLPRIRDTLWLRVKACDNALYCGRNCAETTFYFIPRFETSCDVFPIPITPNGDGRNDVLYFVYPGMLDEPATAIILTPDGNLVRKLFLKPTVPTHGNFWDGKYEDGTPVPTGIYIYMIFINDELICKGTIVVAR